MKLDIDKFALIVVGLASQLFQLGLIVAAANVNQFKQKRGILFFFCCFVFKQEYNILKKLRRQSLPDLTRSGDHRLTSCSSCIHLCPHCLAASASSSLFMINVWLICYLSSKFPGKGMVSEWLSGATFESVCISGEKTYKKRMLSR